ncbi:hypothetical protein [Neobacillus fumarioli]|nr:hypothetical protein [Neobacillus fumarioli]
MIESLEGEKEVQNQAKSNDPSNQAGELDHDHSEGNDEQVGR